MEETAVYIDWVGGAGGGVYLFTLMDQCPGRVIKLVCICCYSKARSAPLINSFIPENRYSG